MKEDILKMAREAGWPDVAVDNLPGTKDMERLKRFAVLVADAEAKRMHAEGMVTVGHMREQINAEREACARIAWNFEPDENGPIETAIRARGQV